ncbi:MAG: hypothetical protein CVV64_05585 [Candidatus Wallbacteria bacterium HGW-Wallbacteria-1]|jgi:hypothetical protein|uniref:Uncharacterized protein n=1 Tax=Candidatus Wallbacteria bacterium HGW-Wallbacteria-1 TaxID=2013854 RepID=A0A2N1PSJ2_9BACT|nr:MAG: hypothetical protein CVV64_05585 [Candidatus Wallbacteria bacterium HGW-Wallbacteria-1]
MKNSILTPFAMAILLAYAFVFIISPCSWAENSNQADFEELYYKALDMEENAKTPSDFQKAAIAYLKLAGKTATAKDRELIASAIFAAGQIYEKRLGNPNRAFEIYQRLNKDFSGTSWASNGTAAMDKLAVTTAQANKMGESIADTGFKTPPQSGVYKKGYKLFDPSMLTPDLLIPVDPIQSAEELAQIEQIMKIPHFPPIQEKEVLTGNGIIKSLYEKIAGAPMEGNPGDLSFMAQLTRENGTDSARVSIMAVEDRIKISFENFEIYMQNSEIVLRIQSMGIHCPIKPNQAGEEIVDRIIQRLGAIPFLQSPFKNYVGRYVKTEDGFHIVDLFSTKQKEPVFISLWIKEDFSSLNHISIQDFDTRRTIITGTVSNLKVASGFDPSLINIPSDSKKRDSIPPDFMPPSIIEM